MKKTILNLSIAAAILQQMIYINDVNAEKGDFVVRVRATNISPDEDSDLYAETANSLGSSTANTLLGSDGGAELSVSSNTIVEVDLSYYWTKNFATEIIAALGSEHDVNIVGQSGSLTDRNLGSVNLLPPTLTGQWHFMPDEKFDPYIGAGVAFVRAMDNGLKEQSYPLAIRIDKNSWAGVLQAGMDYNLDKNWMLNLDVKKYWYNTEVKANVGGTWYKIDDLDVDPWVSSIGVGYRF